MEKGATKLDVGVLLQSLVLPEGLKVGRIIYPDKDDHSVLYAVMFSTKPDDDLTVCVRWLPKKSILRFSVPFELNFDTDNNELLKVAIVAMNDLSDEDYVSKIFMAKLDEDIGGVVSFSMKIPESFYTTSASWEAFKELAAENFFEMLSEAGELVTLVTNNVEGMLDEALDVEDDEDEEPKGEAKTPIRVLQ